VFQHDTRIAELEARIHQLEQDRQR
jgi:hypothetical protein